MSPPTGSRADTAVAAAGTDLTSSDEQTAWLHHHARQANASGTAKVIEVTESDSLDVVLRVSELGVEIGCRGLLIHAETDAARDFYLHLIPEFEQSPTDPLHLVLLMKDIHQTLRA